MFDVKEHVCLIALKYSLEDFLIPPRFLINSNLAPFLKLVDSHPPPPPKKIQTNVSVEESLFVQKVHYTLCTITTT